MRYKILILVLSLIFISAETYSQGTWERIDSPTKQFLKSIYFVDSLYGWAVGNSGTIIHTSDGGDSWSIQDSKTKNEIVDVFFLNRNLGWASEWNYTNIPFGTLLMKTTDGGLNWTAEPYREDNLFITNILFIDSLNGWMGGIPHALVRTTDGGINWEQAHIDTMTFAFFPVLNIQFYNSQYGYACGGRFDIAGVIWRTTTGGDTWIPIDPLYAPPDEIWQMHFFDSLNVIGVGGDPDQFGVGFINTTDAGNTWDYIEIGILGAAKAVSFRTGSEGWAPIPQAHSLVYTLDSAKSWTRVYAPDSSAIYDLIFPDSLHGFAVGEEGAILKYNPPIVDDVKVIAQTTPNGYHLYQNFPNPFNPATNIKFSIPSNEIGKASKVKMVVYDILGNEVATILDKKLLPGSYEIQFGAMIDNRQLVSGIYFYQLRAGGFVHTKKMLLLK
ncbi:MAG: YCF48-related protein [Ignavibacteriaceae bacterium]